MAREQRLNLRLTEAEFRVVEAAAKRAGQTAGAFAATAILQAVAEPTVPTDEAASEAIREFRQVFMQVMELSLTGKLTVGRLDALREKGQKRRGTDVVQ